MDIRERIISEAGSLFTMYGIRSITMDSLAGKMGISKRTIYENFPDKETLLREVILHFKARQLKQASEIMAESDHIVQTIFAMLDRMVNNMKQVNPLFFRDIQKYHAGLFAQIQERGDIRDYSITGSIMDEGIRQGILRKDLNKELVNVTIHELFKLFNTESHLINMGYDHAALFENIIIPYLIGIATPRGRKLIEEQCKKSKHLNK